MAYNEAVNLPIWLAHYRKTAPGATLFVIDHGSNDGSTANLPGVSLIRLPRTAMDEIIRLRFVQNLQAALLKYFTMMIYTDTDELIAVDPDRAASLEAYLAATTYEYASPVGLNLHHIIGVEPPLAPDRPLLAQRRFVRFRSDLCKPLVSRTRLLWEAGFHACNRPLNIDPGLYLIHTKCADRDRALRRQETLRAVKWSHKAIEANHGGHHRFDDERFLREFFLDPANQFRREGAGPFAFDADIEATRHEFGPDGLGPPKRVFNGRFAEIPERFRSLF